MMGLYKEDNPAHFMHCCSIIRRAGCYCLSFQLYDKINSRSSPQIRNPPSDGVQRAKEVRKCPPKCQMFMQTIKIKTKQLDSFMLVSLIYYFKFVFFFSLDIFFLRYWRPSRATRRTWRPRSSGGSSHSHTLW